MGSNRPGCRGGTVRPIHRQSGCLVQTYSPESEISEEFRQDRCEPHTWYCPHHPALTKCQQRRESVQREPTNSPRRMVTEST